MAQILFSGRATTDNTHSVNTPNLAYPKRLSGVFS